VEQLYGLPLAVALTAPLPTIVVVPGTLGE